MGPRKFALLSIAAALATIALKLLAWWLTGSVGLLSDALEGAVNLVGAAVMLAMLTIAALPPDDAHAYGYGKAEYFASGIEGALILAAAILIAIAAVDRLLNPRPLEQLGVGLAVSAVASVIGTIRTRGESTNCASSDRLRASRFPAAKPARSSPSTVTGNRMSAPCRSTSTMASSPRLKAT